MKNLFKDFIDILYPATCPGCNQAYANGEQTLCLGCQLELPLFRNEQFVEHILGGRVPVKAASIYLKFYSGGLTQRLLHEIKYRNNQVLGVYLGERFMLYADNSALFTNIDLIVPVPLHEKKYKQRGYNQSELIATGISNILGAPVDINTVRRATSSETQTRKSREERWLNVDGIFTSDKASLLDKDVLLVDDVITTGATMEACAQEVLKAGAASISFAALATAMK
jgi:ComF family protein